MGEDDVLRGSGSAPSAPAGPLGDLRSRVTGPARRLASPFRPRPRRPPSGSSPDRSGDPNGVAAGLVFFALAVVVFGAAVAVAVLDFAATTDDRGFWAQRGSWIFTFEPATWVAIVGTVLLVFGLGGVKSPGSSGVEGRFAAVLLGLVPLMLTVAVAVTVVTYTLPVEDPGPYIPPVVAQDAASAGQPDQATEAAAASDEAAGAEASRQANAAARERWESWERWKSIVAILVGIVLGAGSGVAIALVQHSRTSGSTADDDFVKEIARRQVILAANVTSWCTPAAAATTPAPGTAATWAPAAACVAACDEATAASGSLQADLTWTDGRSLGNANQSARDRDITGLWTRLHAAEEALLYVAPTAQVLAEGLFDEMRLKDSKIGQAAGLSFQLRRAIMNLGGEVYLVDPPKIPQTTPCPTDDTLFQARTVVRGVRHVVNEFRDSRRGGLIRARNHLAWAGLLTGASGYALLGVAILVKVPTSFVIAAVVYYLIAATIGLFNQLRLSSEPDREQTEEDYGFARAQLLFLPVLAGLAGVGGVVVTALLFAALNGNVIEYSLPEVVDVTDATPVGAELATPVSGETGVAPGDDGLDPARPEDGDPPRLRQIFNLDTNRFGLVIAGLFGLTPGLLVERLQGLASRYKADLRSTSAQDGVRR